MSLYHYTSDAIPPPVLTESKMAAALSLSLLGSFQTILDGRPVTAFGTDKAPALLAYLAVEAGRLHRCDALAGMLWPESSQARAPGLGALSFE